MEYTRIALRGEKNRVALAPKTEDTQMTRINYTARAKRFGTMSSIFCLYCRTQTRYARKVMIGSTVEVSEDKLLTAPFFGVEFGAGKGSILGRSRKDRAFQREVYKAMVSHNRNAHPRNIENMIRLGWIKK